jgi:protein-S-isoprenylcysteine O-methyltransferase Ste14
MNPSIFSWIIDALWLVLVVYLTVSAIGVKRDTQPHLWQSLSLTLGIIIAFVLPHVPIFRFVNFAPITPAISVFGALLCVAGMAFLVWGRQHLGRNWSQTVAIKQEHALVSSGPYRYVRHPMYTGGLVACIGSSIAAGGAWIFLILGTIFVWRVGAEDKLMAQQFPNEYPDYRRQTKALLPCIW